MIDSAASRPKPSGVLRTLGLLSLFCIHLLWVSTGAALAVAPVSGLPASADATNAKTAVDGHGDAIAVWIARTARGAELVSASRRAGGSWGVTEIVSSTVQTDTPGVSPAVSFRVVLEQNGTAHASWLDDGADTGLGPTLLVSSRQRGGVWENPVAVATPDATRQIAVGSDLAVTGEGTLIVLWVMLPSGPWGGAGSLPVATAYVTERSPAGTWQPPRLLGPASAAADPRLAVNRAAGVSAIWWSPRQGPPAIGERTGPLAHAFREDGGVWNSPRLIPGVAPVPGFQPVPTSHLLDDTGRALVIVQASQPDDTTYRGLVTVDPLSGPSLLRRIPSPSSRQLRGGWLGGTDVSGGAAAALDAAGRLVVVYGGTSDASAVPGAIWAATHLGDGRWAITSVDQLAGSANASEPTLASDDHGHLVATWKAEGADREKCLSTVYRATRGVNGRWSRRALDGPPIRRQRDASDSCTAARSTPGVVGWETGAWRGRPGRAPSFSASARQTTWQDVRRAGAIDVRCVSPSTGVCRVSLLGAAQRFAHGRKPREEAKDGARGALNARALACLSYLAARKVRSHDPRGVVTLSVSGRCLRDVKPPGMSFEALVTYDALGREAASKRVTITIRR